jgi:hypothetical protein
MFLSRLTVTAALGGFDSKHIENQANKEKSCLTKQYKKYILYMIKCNPREKA